MGTRTRTIRWQLGVCGLFLCAGPAVADPASPAQGNTLNPVGAAARYTPDERGLSSFRSRPSRTPAGFLYATPNEPPTWTETDQAGAFNWHVEAGVLGLSGNDRARHFTEYSDWDPGLLLNSFSLNWLSRDEIAYLELSGGGAGRDDQFYRAEGGQYGRFRLSGFFSETPHVFASNAVSPYEGIGGGNLRLPDGIAPRPAGDNSALQTALAGTDPFTVRLERNRAGLELDYHLGTAGRLFAGYSRETRSGTRPYGGTFGAEFYNGFSGAVETIEPIDHSAHNLSLSAHLTRPDTQANLVYSGSWFVNHQATLEFDNPFQLEPVPPVGPVAARRTQRGRMALAPDNQAHHIKLDIARRLPWWRSRLTGGVSWNRMTQDEALLPPTITANNPALFDPVDWSRYNTIAALSQTTADAEITQWQGHLKLHAAPLRSLSLNMGVTFFDEDNDTDYTAFNPLTGEFGYIIEDGAHVQNLGLHTPGAPAERVRYRNIPFERKELELFLDAALRLPAASSLGLELRRREIDRQFRERNETTEDSLCLRFNNRALDRANLRLTLEAARRDGSNYDHFPYEAFYSSSLPDYVPPARGLPPHTLADLRKYDLADRDRLRFHGMVNILLRDDMDLALSGEWSEDTYGADFGLRQRKNAAVNAEWSWQPAPAVNTYLYASYQRYERAMRGANDVGNGTNPTAGGPVFSASGFWSETLEGETGTLGAGLDLKLGKVTLRSNYSYLSSSDDLDYDFNSPDALAVAPGGLVATAAEAGGGFPSIRFQRHTWETSIHWPFNERIDVRLYHRFENTEIRDWHYAGLAPLINNTMLLNAAPQNYNVHAIGMFLRWSTN